MIKGALTTILFTSILSIVLNQAFSQTTRICELKYDSIEQIVIAAELDTLSQEALFIKSVMDKIGLPMNMRLLDGHSHSIKETIATIDDDKTRSLIINSPLNFEVFDSTNIFDVFTIAHELGHHISNQSLTLKEDRFQEARAVCNINSNKYQQKGCRLKFTFQHSKRQLEQQADTYAGYILATLEYRLQDIESLFNQIPKNNVDYYPTDKDRISSIKNGYFRALENKAYTRKINLEKMKQLPIYSAALWVDKNKSLKNKDKNSKMCSPVIIDNDQFTAVTNSNIEILNLDIVDNLLRLKLKHIGGCEGAVVKLIDAGRIAESFPVQKSLRISINNAHCNELIVKDYYFDMTDILTKNVGGIIRFRIDNVKTKTRPFKCDFKVEF